MSKSASPANLDPVKAWREWFVQNEREWSESLTRMIKDDAVSRALGQKLHAALYQQQALSKSMAGPMAAMNLPTREDVAALGERLGQLEDAVARIEAAMVQLKTAVAGDAPKPPRTRKPPVARKPSRGSKAADRHDAD